MKVKAEVGGWMDRLETGFSSKIDRPWKDKQRELRVTSLSAMSNWSFRDHLLTWASLGKISITFFQFLLVCIKVYLEIKTHAIQYILNFNL